MNTFAGALSEVRCANAVSAANLTMFPLLIKGEQEPSYLTLDEALAQVEADDYATDAEIEAAYSGFRK